MQVKEITPCFASTVYHFPIRTSSNREYYPIKKRFVPTFVNSYSYMVGNIVFPDI